MGRSRDVADRAREAVLAAFPAEQFPEMRSLDVRHSRRALEVRLSVRHDGDDYFHGHWIGHMEEAAWIEELLLDLGAWLRSHQLKLRPQQHITLEQLEALTRETLQEDMGRDFRSEVNQDHNEVLVHGWFLLRLDEEVVRAYTVEDCLEEDDEDALAESLVEFGEVEAVTQQVCGLLLRLLDHYSFSQEGDDDLDEDADDDWFGDPNARNNQEDEQ